MSQIYIPGPAFLYAGVGGTPENRVPLYLGTSVGDVRVEFRGTTVPVFNSIGGRSVPIDEFWDGELAFVAFAINFVEHAVAERLMTQPSPFLTPVSPAPGLNLREAIGTLFGTEGFTFPFWVRAPYQQFPAFANQSPGKRFWSCIVESPKSMDFGAKDKTYNFVIKATRAFTNAASPLSGAMVSTAQGYPTRFILCDEDMNGLPDPT